MTVMLLEKFQSRLTEGIESEDTTAILESVVGIPAVPFMGLLDHGTSKAEAVLVTAVNTVTKVITITKAQRGSADVAHDDSAIFHHSEVEMTDLKTKETFAAAGNGIYIQHTFTLATAGALKSIRAEIVYQPAAGGYGTPIPIVGKVILGEAAEFTGGQAAMYGVQGQIDFLDGATVNQSSSIFAGLRGVISGAGTPIFSDFDTIAGLYVDNLCSIDLKDIATGYGSALASLQNHGGWLDHGLFIRGGNKITNVFGFAALGGGALESGLASEDEISRIRISIDDVAWWINIYRPSA